MDIGIVGLGKLGMPVAVAMDYAGHSVMGYDLNPDQMQKESWPCLECGLRENSHFEPMLRASNVRFGDLPEVIEHGDIIFVSVQTPHAPQFEGVTRLPSERADFDYSHLRQAICDIAAIIDSHKIVAIISTVLPGTLRREVMPLANKYMRVVYNPSFIGMGTVIRDFLHPEFVLMGSDNERALDILCNFYQTTVDASTVRVGLETAEAIKVLYNTFITSKIVFANTAMEIAHKIGADIDDIISALGLATERLISPRYLSGGMGDGGGCHPRDNIALSWLARRLDLSFDLFGALMEARERQAEWLCDLMCEHDLPKFILGTAFKGGSNIETGSAAVLCKNILEERGYSVGAFDPYVDGGPIDLLRMGPAVFLIGTNHPEFIDYRFPPGSIVIDPWRMVPPDQYGVDVVRIGDSDDQ